MRWSLCYSYLHGFVVFATMRLLGSLGLLLCLLSVLFNTLFTTIGDDSSGLYVSHAIVCLFSMHYFLSFLLLPLVSCVGCG